MARFWRRGFAAIALAGVVALVVTVFVAPSADAAPPAQTRSAPLGALLAKLRDPAPTKDGYFGYSVAVSGTTAIVGAYTDSFAGAAFIYAKGASGWPTTPSASLADPGENSSDGFGSSVAVSGSTAVVGAFGTNSDTGATYLYVKGSSGWPTDPTTALPDPEATANDYFGYSVAVSGKTAIASANWGADGPVFIYAKGASGWPTKPTAGMTDPSKAAEYFGYSVAVSGKTGVVGAWGTRRVAGAAYIYKA